MGGIRELTRRVFNIALFGCGGVARMHMAAYAAHPERIRVVAACDPDEGQISKLGADYALGRTFRTIEETVAGIDFEVGVVCTPTPVHPSAVSELAAAGKHVFVEKPLADTRDQAEAAVAACAEAGVKLAVNQNFRVHYPFDAARSAILAGKIGTPITVAHQDLMFRQDKGWRIQVDRHALSVMGIHWFDGFRWMLGVEATHITSRTASSPAIDCRGETEAVTLLTFANQAVVSYVESFSSQVHRTDTVVIGDRGALLFDYGELSVFDSPDRRGQPTERRTNPLSGRNKPEATFVMLDKLLTALEESIEPDNGGADNLKTVSLLDAAYRSADARGIVVEMAS